jgi:hypothetical protein
MRFRTLLLCATAAVSIGSTSALVSAVGTNDGVGVPAQAVQRAERVSPPIDLFPDRPRVFMAFHGMNRLANDSGLDSQWRFVQNNLDGFWGNNARISRAEIARLVRKTDTRQLSTESEFGGSSFYVETYAGLEREHPDISFNREAITFYSDQPHHWDGDTMADARRAVSRANYEGGSPYTAVYTGWQPQNFYPNGEGSRPPIRPGSAAERALLDGDGTFVECPNDVCNGVVYEDGFFRAMRTARAENQRFVWLASRPPGFSPKSGWLSEFQTMYNRADAEGLWRPGDIVVVIAYEGDYPLVPESVNGQAADTTTGLMYWALNQ